MTGKYTSAVGKYSFPSTWMMNRNQLEKAGTSVPENSVKLAYLAHPVSGDIEANLANVKKWFRFVQDKMGFTVCSNWITMVEVYNDADQAQRNAAIFRDLRVVERCDVIILAGGKVTKGMKAELDHAINNGLTVIDLTWYGYEAPCEQVQEV